MRTSDTGRLKRSYERNVGHSRFWAGVGTALLAGLLLFVVNALWEVGKNPDAWTPLAENLFMLGVVTLGEAVGISFVIAWTFRNLYRLDDATLAEMERGNQEETP